MKEGDCTVSTRAGQWLLLPHGRLVRLVQPVSRVEGRGYVDHGLFFS